MPCEPAVSQNKGREVSGNLVFIRTLSHDALLSCKIILNLDRIAELSISDGPVFVVLQKPETLKQTNNPLQWVFAGKGVLLGKIYSFNDQSY